MHFDLTNNCVISERKLKNSADRRVEHQSLKTTLYPIAKGCAQSISHPVPPYFPQKMKKPTYSPSTYPSGPARQLLTNLQGCNPMASANTKPTPLTACASYRCLAQHLIESCSPTFHPLRDRFRKRGACGKGAFKGRRTPSRNFGNESRAFVNYT